MKFLTYIEVIGGFWRFGKELIVMPEWKHKSSELINGVEIVVRERVDRRNHHGATEYIIEVKKDEKVIHSERHPYNVWVGHCNGQILKPLIAERALKKLAT